MVQRLLAVMVSPTLMLLAASPAVTVAPVGRVLAGISVVAPSTPEFAAAFAAIVPAANRAAFDPILPYSIVVRNAAPKAVVGLCVRFEIIATENARPYRMVVIQGQIPPLEKPVLGTHDQLFLSPENDYNQAARRETEPRNHTYRPLEFYADARSISITVDSVLYADGSFAGPDKEGLFDTYTAQLAAEEKGAKAVLSYRGKPSAELEDYLAKTAALDHSIITGGRPDASTRRLSQQSRAWQQLLKRHGSDALFESAETALHDAEGFRITRQAANR